MKELEAEVARLRMENEFLKSSGLLRTDAPVAERCAVIDAERANYKVAWMCRLLGVPRSSFMPGGTGPRPLPRPGTGIWPAKCGGSSRRAEAPTGAGGSLPSSTARVTAARSGW